MKKLSVCKNNFLKNVKKGFTIVELLVVIVVIGILAAITIVSYTGITSKAVASTLQADLSGASNKLKIWQLSNDSGDYPETIDCNIPDSTTNLCIRPSGTNSYSYTVDNISRPRTFSLTETSTNGAVSYKITHDSAPVAVTSTSPVIASPLADTITNTGAILRTSITSDGGAPITDSGFCWGLSLNPTDNCTSATVGALAPLSPSSVSAGSCSQVVSSPNGDSFYSIDMCNGIIYMYDRDVTTGALTALSPATITIPGTCFGVPKLSADGVSLYITGRDPSCGPGNLLFMYTRNTTTGLLAASSPSTMPFGDCSNMILSSDGGNLYSVDMCSGVVSMYGRNATTGALTALSPATITISGTCFNTPQLSADGKSIYIPGRDPSCGPGGLLFILNRDTTTGILTAPSPSSISVGDCSYALMPNDSKSLYMVDVCNGIISMYNRDATTGVLTALSPATITIPGTCFNTPTITADGKSIYIPGRDAGCSIDSLFIFNRDIITGALTAPSPSSVSIGSCPSVSSSVDGKTVYAVDNCNGVISMYDRNATTGILTALSPASITVGGTCFSAPVMSADGNSFYMPGRDSTCSVGLLFAYGRNTNANSSMISKSIAGMPSGTLIHYRGYATNSAGTSYTTDATFTTAL